MHLIIEQQVSPLIHPLPTKDLQQRAHSIFVRQNQTPQWLQIMIKHVIEKKQLTIVFNPLL